MTGERCWLRSGAQTRAFQVPNTLPGHHMCNERRKSESPVPWLPCLVIGPQQKERCSSRKLSFC